MVLSQYHPFYSDDVPFASLPCAVRTASPALCHGYWGCAAGRGAGNALWTDLPGTQHTRQRAGAALGAQHAWQLWPGLLGEHGRETLSRWPLCSLAGPTNTVASPATGWWEGPVQLHGVKRFLPAQL